MSIIGQRMLDHSKKESRVPGYPFMGGVFLVPCIYVAPCLMHNLVLKLRIYLVQALMHSSRQTCWARSMMLSCRPL